jgi:D-alanyl-D-alanine carboxypeptidase
MDEHLPGSLPRRTLLKGGVALPLSLMALGRSRSGAGERGDVRRDELQEALDGMVGAYGDPAERAVAAIGRVDGRNGPVPWRGAAGYADRQHRREARARTDYRFRGGSVTKTFTATVVLQLVGEGRVGLDDPVGRHLPDLVPGQDRITVRHLLELTSGLPDFVSVLFPSMERLECRFDEFLAATSRPISPRELVRRATGPGLLFAPGTMFHYSTTNYLMLGLLIEQVTGHPYRAELERRITRPLGLHRTDVPNRPGLAEPYLRGYTHFDDRPEEWVDVSVRQEQGWAGGALVTTQKDLARFFAALLGGRLLPPPLLAAMQTPSGAPPLLGPPPPGAPSGEVYGLGLQRSGDLWGHGGDTHGYSHRALASADGRTQILVARTGYPARLGRPVDPFAPFLQVARDAAG